MEPLRHVTADTPIGSAAIVSIRHAIRG
jgi:hypothetical protein